MKLSIRQIKAARALLGWSQEVLSAKSGVPLSTLKRIEAGDADGLPSSANAKKIENALTLGKQNGVVFISPGTNGGAGVRLKK